MAEPPTRPAAAKRDKAEVLLLLVAGTALVIGIVGRLLVGWDAPLWLDEAYTGAIAIQPTLQGLIEDCLKELGGPVYYTLVWLWAKLFGAGDVALRVPSFLCAAAAPLIILWKGHPDLRLRATWAALSATWLPGFYYATEARSYSLLFLLGSVQLIFLTRFLRSTRLRDACWWSALSSIMILTHTHAVIITALQGAVLLYVYRMSLFRYWPAALLLLPPALWLLVRLPILLRFTDPKATWFRLLVPRQLLGLPELLLGQTGAALPLAIVLLGGGVMLARRAATDRTSLAYESREWLPVLASVMAIALVIAIGFIKPSFTFRYLIPFAPGLLFGIALLACAWRRPIVPVALIAITCLATATDVAGHYTDPKRDMRRGYSWEGASRFLQTRGVRRVLFVWDNPTATGGDRSQLGRVGAFFLHRAGVPAEGDAVTIGSGSDEDFRRAIYSATDAPPVAGDVVGVITLGRVLPLQQAKVAWECRRYGGPEVAYDADVYVTACVRPPLRHGPAD